MRAPVELWCVLSVEHDHVEQTLPHPMAISRVELEVTGDASVQVWVTRGSRRILCTPGGARAHVEFTRPLAPEIVTVRIERVSSYGPRVRADALFFS